MLIMRKMVVLSANKEKRKEEIHFSAFLKA
jgi:hypothetical protein